MQSKEARLILGAAIVDDILAIAVLSVVTTMVQTGNMTPEITGIIFLILKILGLFAALIDWSSITSAKTTSCRKTLEVKR